MNEYEVWLSIDGATKVAEIISHSGAGAVKFALAQFPGSTLVDCVFVAELSDLVQA